MSIHTLPVANPAPLPTARKSAAPANTKFACSKKPELAHNGDTVTFSGATLARIHHLLNNGQAPLPPQHPAPQLPIQPQAPQPQIPQAIAAAGQGVAAQFAQGGAQQAVAQAQPAQQHPPLFGSLVKKLLARFS